MSKSGIIYCDETLNPIYHRECKDGCELADHCYVNTLVKRFGWPTEGVHWRPEVLKKINIKGSGDLKALNTCHRVTDLVGDLPPGGLGICSLLADLTRALAGLGQLD